MKLRFVIFVWGDGKLIYFSIYLIPIPSSIRTQVGNFSDMKNSGSILVYLKFCITNWRNRWVDKLSTAALCDRIDVHSSLIKKKVSESIKSPNKYNHKNLERYT